jgi:demethylmenaquinone methyltransferase/2-methoxy-6-polyprenyl-1,4-benzoquinol methylase
VSSLRQIYYDLFSKIYDPIIRLHSKDQEGLLRTFIVEKACLSEGNVALDLCTGTGSVALELARRVSRTGLTIGLDFSEGMLRTAKRKAFQLGVNQLHFVQADASHLPFKSSSFHGVTCSHAFYELKGIERREAIAEVARILVQGGSFCLMEHAKPEKFFQRLFFYIRILFLGSRDVQDFLTQGEAILGEKFGRVTTAMSPTGRSKLIFGERLSIENP